VRIFSLRANTPNIGNALIALGTDAILRSVFGSDVSLINLPVHANGNPKAGGLTAQTVYEINQLADGLIIGPGNLFENGALTMDFRALAALSVPVMILDVSMGRVFDRTGKLVPRTDSIPAEKILALCRAAEPILVRDRATSGHLAELGWGRAQVTGCPTLFIEDVPRYRVLDPALAETALVSIRNPRLMSVPYSVQGRIYQDLRRMIDALRGMKMDVRLLCHDYQDLPFAEAFPDVPMLYTEDPWRFLSWLRGCRLNIGFRLHAFLCCLALGVPSIPLTYDERGMGLIETVGMSDWAVPFLHTEDLLGEIHERCDSLPRFDEMKLAARPIWDGLRRCTVQALERFGERMESHASNRSF
jgi:hypothetical protein